VFPASVAVSVTFEGPNVAVGVPENTQLAPFTPLTLAVTPAGAGAAIFMQFASGGLPG
jgi:hypothetical protein